MTSGTPICLVSERICYVVSYLCHNCKSKHNFSVWTSIGSRIIECKECKATNELNWDVYAKWNRRKETR